jgi:hypothetical protein
MEQVDQYTFACTTAFYLSAINWTDEQTTSASGRHPCAGRRVALELVRCARCWCCTGGFDSCTGGSHHNRQKPHSYHIEYVMFAKKFTYNPQMTSSYCIGYVTLVQKTLQTRPAFDRSRAPAISGMLPLQQTRAAINTCRSSYWIEYVIFASNSPCDRQKLGSYSVRKSRGQTCKMSSVAVA